MRQMCVCIEFRAAITLLLVHNAVKPFPATVSVAVVLLVPLMMALAGFSCKELKFIFLLSGCYFILFYPFYNWCVGRVAMMLCLPLGHVCDKHE